MPPTPSGTHSCVGDYVPGQRLVEADLCARFGVNRARVRSAFQQLAAEGLVEIQRNRGARVREFSLGEAIEITEVRRVVEGLGAARAARAAELAGPAQAEVLRGLGADLAKAATDGELTTYNDLDAGPPGSAPRLGRGAASKRRTSRVGGKASGHCGRCPRARDYHPDHLSGLAAAVSLALPWAAWSRIRSRRRGGLRG
jgi:hypothetical protein